MLRHNSTFHLVWKDPAATYGVSENFLCMSDGMAIDVDGEFVKWIVMAQSHEPTETSTEAEDLLGRIVVEVLIAIINIIGCQVERNTQATDSIHLFQECTSRAFVVLQPMIEHTGFHNVVELLIELNNYCSICRRKLKPRIETSEEVPSQRRTPFNISRRPAPQDFAQVSRVQPMAGAD